MEDIAVLDRATVVESLGAVLRRYGRDHLLQHSTSSRGGVFDGGARLEGRRCEFRDSSRLRHVEGDLDEMANAVRRDVDVRSPSKVVRCICAIIRVYQCHLDMEICKECWHIAIITPTCRESSLTSYYYGMMTVPYVESVTLSRLPRWVSVQYEYSTLPVRESIRLDAGQ